MDTIINIKERIASVVLIPCLSTYDGMAKWKGEKYFRKLSFSIMSENIPKRYVTKKSPIVIGMDNLKWGTRADMAKPTARKTKPTIKKPKNNGI